MDETPAKAGPSGKEKMKTGWFWPLFGYQDEVVFTYADSRARAQIEKVLVNHF
ncbi:MAG: transposase [Candidatus Azotimanducaceae bacterium]|jgi:transposase